METPDDTEEAAVMLRFWKYQGIGNDFVLIDNMDMTAPMDPEFVMGACDRHFGIGADGILYVMPGVGTDVTMRIMNADGSEAEMCGNGIRCVARHAYDTGMVRNDVFTIHTLAGDMTARIDDDMIEIDMGAPILDGRSIPMDHDGRFINEEMTADGVTFHGNGVSMGNPHLVIFDQLDDAAVHRLGPILESSPLFPNRTNVEFATVADGRIHIRVYERGAAWTLACGTGACATTVAAALNGLVGFDVPVDVRLPGGWLKITIASDLSNVRMAGPAELVFEGILME